ncbi:MAG: aminopeptidase P family protein, partial [Lentisphaeria bacterium]|nr:aminopeptidase P family protein [Lentisphaeria bacterium]
MPQKSDFSSKNTKTLSSSPSKLIIGSASGSADILYGSGFHAEDDFIYFEHNGRKGIVVSSLEYSRALEQAKKGVEVLEYSSLMSKNDVVKGLPGEVALSRFLQVKEWTVPASFPFGKALNLAKDGIGIRCAEGGFFPEREVKTEEEISCIRKSVHAVEEIMQDLRNMIRESKVDAQGFLVLAGKVLTSEFLRRELESNFKRIGFTANHTIIACGKDAAAPHNTGNGPLRANETIVADIFPRDDESGYWGDMTRTFVKGKAPLQVKKAYEAVLGASEAAFKVLRAGATGAGVHAVAAEYLKSAGFVTGKDENGLPCGFFHGLGHGVGLEIHEGPRLSPSDPRKLAAGNVVSVEPG